MFCAMFSFTERYIGKNSHKDIFICNLISFNNKLENLIITPTSVRKYVWGMFWPSLLKLLPQHYVVSFTMHC